MNKINDDMARRLMAMLPTEAIVQIETTTDNFWVTHGDGERGFFVTGKATVDFSDERFRAEVLSAWDALINGAEMDEHGVRMIGRQELEEHKTRMLAVEREPPLPPPPE